MFVSAAMAGFMAAPAIAQERRRTQEPPAAQRTAEQMVAVELTDLTWRSGPAYLPSGLQVAVVQGNPETGPSVRYLYLPDGYTIPDHYHEDTESGVVVQGTILMGHPDARLTAYHEGAFVSTPPRMPHRVRCQSKGGCIVSISRASAADFFFAKPADDPRQRAPRAR
jgi:anti-sigma factor ChrR (cupin superfamily)